MRLSHNGYLELILRAQRNAFHRAGCPQSRLFAELSFSCARDSAFFVFHPAMTKSYERRAYHVMFAESHIGRTRSFPYAPFCQPFYTQIHCELMKAYDEPLSVGMYGLLALLAFVENGYDP
ncbi:MAG: hypothetical protein QOH71_4188 [Blastocatellia bacterium]|nr:hypothetical protein [Blastocatellia bacterium]